jgi:hypothetical protein
MWYIGSTVGVSWFATFNLRAGMLQNVLYMGNEKRLAFYFFCVLYVFSRL